MLSSALAPLKNAYSEPKSDIPALAAAYAFGIIKNHPFVDGNRRTGYVLCRTFLKINGQDIDATDVEKYQTFLGVPIGFDQNSRKLMLSCGPNAALACSCRWFRLVQSTAWNHGSTTLGQPPSSSLAA